MRRYIEAFERRLRHLPHWEGPGATYFITFTLRRPPPVDLTDRRIGALVVDQLRRFDGERYLLYDYTVMPDHVHVILMPLADGTKAFSLSRIMHGIKSWLAHRINEVTGRQGPLWQDESYDHIIRDEADYQSRAKYILDNPHTEGLIDEPTEWPWWRKGSGS